MRSTSLLPCALGLALLVAAGGCGGATAGEAPTGAASLGGGVTAVDGSTAKLGGVSLVLQQTGERVVSGPDGSFRFTASPLGDVVLELGTDDRGTDDRGTDDDGMDDDGMDDDDAVERDDRRIEIRDVRGGERIDVRLRLRDGRVERIDVARGGGGADGRELEIDMRRGPDADDPDMSGEVELESEPHGEEFEVEVEHATPGRSLRAVVLDPTGAEYDLGIRVVDALGEAEWERETEHGQELPFGVSGVAELVGHVVQVRDAGTDGVLLTVELPELPTLPADDDERDGDDDGDDDSEEDDDSRDDS